MSLTPALGRQAKEGRRAIDRRMPLIVVDCAVLCCDAARAS